MPAVTSPALDVCLAHEIGFQFGHHNADDSDKDEEIHLQGRWVSGWKPSRDARSSLVLLPAPPQAHQNSPSPAHATTHPNGKEDGQPDDEPVIHVRVPGPAAGGGREPHTQVPSWTQTPACSAGTGERKYT